MLYLWDIWRKNIPSEETNTVILGLEHTFRLRVSKKASVVGEEWGRVRVFADKVREGTGGQIVYAFVGYK